MFLIVHPGTDTMIDLEEIIIVEVEKNDYQAIEPMTTTELLTIAKRQAKGMELRPPVAWIDSGFVPEMER